MLELGFDATKAPMKVLLLGAHSDDIEIGCAGTLNRLISRGGQLSVEWCVFSAEGIREKEARMSADRLLRNVDQVRVNLLRFRNGYFPHVGAEIKDYFEALKRQIDPDLIFTHYRNDRHQDHRTISDLTWNTFRNHLIFEYEIAKYDGDFGSPNFFVPLTESVLEGKIAQIVDCFRSQHSHAWFQPATFRAIARLRGVECNAPSGFAEAFYVRKAVLA